MTNKKKVRALSPYVLLAYLMVVTFVLTGVSFARFGVTSNNAADSATAATFEFSLEQAITPEAQLYLDADGTEHGANYVFKIKSISEVPVTYDVYVITPDGSPILPFGTEIYLTPIGDELSASDASTKLANAQSGTYHASTHLHRPDSSTTHKFVGCGYAPAGTHVQTYNLNIHYATKNNTPQSGNYKVTGLVSRIWDNLQIKVVARDGRHSAAGNASRNDSNKYTDPYVAE